MKATVSATTTTTVQKTVKLAPALRRKLVTALKTYAELATQVRALEHAKKGQSDIVREIQVDLGEDSLLIEGFKTTLVSPVKKTLNKKKFVAKGGDLALLESCYDEIPSSDYVRITPPGNKEGDLDDLAELAK